MSGWRPALRIARRDALRHRSRSILVLVMISLPVLAVSAAAVVIKTAEVSGVEEVSRTLGAADARIHTEGRGQVLQLPDPRDFGWRQMDVDYDDPPTPDEVRAVLGAHTRLLPITTGWGRARVSDRVIDFTTTGVDLSDPLAEGLFDLEQGRLPEAEGDVVVNDPLLAKGLAIGDEIEVNGAARRIVGVGRDATVRDKPVMLGSTQDLPEDEDNIHEWLVGAGPVSWSQVRGLNRIGGVVTSRAVLADPPDVASMAEQMGYDTGRNEAWAVLVLIVVMALLEVVLLAGPAFAVGARRHARTLALIAASGGTPAQSRRVILGSGMVLGAVASALGLVLGIGVGWLLLPQVQRLNGEWFGPFDLPWGYLGATAGCGLLSALLASVVPAWLASRQDVVAVLAGRRGDRKARAATPILGLLLLGLGVVGSAYGAWAIDFSRDGGLWIAVCAVISVLGMILVVPVVVTVIAKMSGRLPLTVRYAARDAARHRARTVPAVAAVAATVAGVVALGIANASYESMSRAGYVPSMAMGTAQVVLPDGTLARPGQSEADMIAAAQQQWVLAAELAVRTVPDAVIESVVGVPEALPDEGWLRVSFRPDGRVGEWDWGGYSGWGVSGVLVADALPSPLRFALKEDQTDAADKALAAGKAVVFTSRPVVNESMRVVTERTDGNGKSDRRRHDGVPVSFVEVDDMAPATAVLPPALIEELGLPAVPMALMISDTDITKAQETDLKESLGGAISDVEVDVERGYQRSATNMIITLVLFTLAGVLMLGGTLTATFLALSDARPDLATLSAVGASPRTRRGVAASYAVVVGLVGALLGAGVGFIPGIAISHPLTSLAGSGTYLDIPWLLIAGLVVALPLLTAAIVGLTARSRLPLVARSD